MGSAGLAVYSAGLPVLGGGAEMHFGGSPVLGGGAGMHFGGSPVLGGGAGMHFGGSPVLGGGAGMHLGGSLTKEYVTNASEKTADKTDYVKFVTWTSGPASMTLPIALTKTGFKRPVLLDRAHTPGRASGLSRQRDEAERRASPGRPLERGRAPECSAGRN
jgi:hypothetical protein